MAEAGRPSPVKLIMGVIFSREGILIAAQKKLEKRFGPCDFQSPAILFDYTDYYQPQMGLNLKRQFLGFQRLIQPRKLAAIKLFTNRLEKALSRGSEEPARPVKYGAGGPRRLINLDPGYICTSKLVLATCKNYSHRIYLDKGVYAEVTLHFRDGSFAPWPWTYPDYKSKEYIEGFNRIREIYLEQLKHQPQYHQPRYFL